jgi:hypothetical protein
MYPNDDYIPTIVLVLLVVLQSTLQNLVLIPNDDVVCQSHNQHVVVNLLPLQVNWELHLKYARHFHLLKQNYRIEQHNQ